MERKPKYCRYLHLNLYFYKINIYTDNPIAGELKKIVTAMPGTAKVKIKLS